MEKKCVTEALIVLAFGVFLCLAIYMEIPAKTYGKDKFSDPDLGENRLLEMPKIQEAPEEDSEEPRPIADLSGAFSVILQGVTREFIAGYVIDETFLMWLDAQYGDDLIISLAYCVLEDRMDLDEWYALTGNSIHVLWLRFCQDTGFQDYRLENVYWRETAKAGETVISFAGDFNFAEDWCTTEYMNQQPNGVYDCFSSDLLEEMQTSDLLLMNNEFVYSARGSALLGKAYTFRADPKMVDMLSVFGADIVTLANNHVYDYGNEGLLDTLRYLEQAGMPYVGAGRNLEEASKSVAFVANGRKITIVSASEIERATKYTREATETESGVLKTLNPDRFLQIIRDADAVSDYVIAVVHWGTEGALKQDGAQERLAAQYVQAGADAVIGGHPHRLQGADYKEGVPIAYSLGNFWFSDGTLYTTLAQLVISEDGAIRLRFLPCIQKELTTCLITDEEEKAEFYHYLASISGNIGLDEAGNVYDKSAEDYPAEKIVYNNEGNKTRITGLKDNEGRTIDIVGNLK